MENYLNFVFCGPCGDDSMVVASDGVKGKKIGQKERFLQELSHLEKAQKSGIVSLQEYKQVKLVLEKKITAFEKQTKQDAVKEKIIEDLVGKPLTPSKKGSEKYFVRLDKEKEVPLLSSQKQAKATKEASKKLPKKETEKSSAEKHTIAITQQETASLDTSGTILPSSSAERSPSPMIPSESESPPFKHIDDLVNDQEPHWRLGFVMLTLFLLILLYVKFTSFGSVDPVVSVDVYLDYSSSYSHETYTLMQELLATYDDRLWLNYHLVGPGEQNALASAAIACAEDQGQEATYLQVLFTKDPASWKTVDDLLLFSQDLGLDTSLFRLCMEGDVKMMLYTREVNAALAEDITYTPTLVINSKKIVGAVGAEAVQQVIDTELQSLG